MPSSPSAIERGWIEIESSRSRSVAVRVAVSWSKACWSRGSSSGRQKRRERVADLFLDVTDDQLDERGRQSAEAEVNSGEDDIGLGDIKDRSLRR